MSLLKNLIHGDIYDLQNTVCNLELNLKAVEKKLLVLQERLSVLENKNLENKK